MESLIGIISLIIIIAFCAIIGSYNKKAKKVKKIKQDKNASLFITLLHYSGLPVAQNIYTKIFSKPNEYEFCANNMTFKLLKEKVTDVAITNDVEIQKSNVSSIGGAIGGAFLFGPLGSMIGGRSKEKTSNIVTSYLVFTYLDHDEIKYISFNCILIIYNVFTKLNDSSIRQQTKRLSYVTCNNYFSTNQYITTNM